MFRPSRGSPARAQIALIHGLAQARAEGVRGATAALMIVNYAYVLRMCACYVPVGCIELRSTHYTIYSLHNTSRKKNYT